MPVRPPAPGLHLVDDRGQSLGRTVDICFRIELRTDCQQVPPGKVVVPPAGFSSLPLPLPGSTFSRARAALRRVLAIFAEVIREHRARPREDGLSRRHATVEKVPAGAMLVDGKPLPFL